MESDHESTEKLSIAQSVLNYDKNTNMKLLSHQNQCEGVEQCKKVEMLQQNGDIHKDEYKEEMNDQDGESVTKVPNNSINKDKLLLEPINDKYKMENNHNGIESGKSSDITNKNKTLSGEVVNNDVFDEKTTPRDDVDNEEVRVKKLKRRKSCRLSMKECLDEVKEDFFDDVLNVTHANDFAGFTSNDTPDGYMLLGKYLT